MGIIRRRLQLKFMALYTGTPWGSVCPACAQRATIVLTIPTFTPGLPSPREGPQIDQSEPQTFPAKHNSIKRIS